MTKKRGKIENLVPFVKGTDVRRNLKGPPKKLPHIDELLDKVLGAEKDGVSACERILVALQKMAEKGDTRAAEIMLDRAFGKAKQQIELTSKVINVIIPIKPIIKSDGTV